MSVSREEAATTLQDLSRAQARSSALYGYQATTPYWIMWGILAIAGYALEQLFPMQWFVVWGAVDSIGFAACLAPRVGRTAFTWRDFATTALLFLVCYAIGYRAAGLDPRHANAAFWLATTVGIGASIAITRASGRAVAGGWQIWAIFAAVALSYAGLFALMARVPERVAWASAPLLLATVFVLWGVYAGRGRYAAAGVGTAMLTLAVSFTVHDHVALWIAAVLCGSLLLVGVWMRRV